MTAPDTTFQLELTASRLEKGLLAIPRRYYSLFPPEGRDIFVLFDRAKKPLAKAFSPYDSKTKECRIFGLARWFLTRQLVPGDLINISLVKSDDYLYRIVSDRHMQLRLRDETRRKLYSAATETEAKAHLDDLAKVNKDGFAQTARAELLRLAEKSQVAPRARVKKSRSDPRAAVPAAIRLLLTELHHGKCQLCSFAFVKRDGNPYFEIHHVDANVGDHPMNLLVVCGNCHAQLEHAHVSKLEITDGWLVAVTINGTRIGVRQPLLQEPASPGTVRIVALLMALHMMQTSFPFGV
jgi:hypothetical protein